MSRFTKLRKGLGISGIAFVIFLVLFLLCYFTGRILPAAIIALFLIPLTGMVLFRALRWIQLHSLWSVRNRLLFVYGLMAILPLFLILTLVGLGAWALTTELAVYLATSALDRRVDSIQNAMRVLDGMTTAQRITSAADFQKGMSQEFPSFRLYIKDEAGERKFPTNSSDLKLPKDWKSTSGLLVVNHHFYGWSHIVSERAEITGLAPLSNAMIAGLVPNLGKIGLVEQSHNDKNAGPQVEGIAPENDAAAQGPFHLPPAMNRFDVPLIWAASVAHSHLENPNQAFDGVLYINSRASAVFGTVFAKAESFRGALLQFFVVVAILFLIVETVAIIIGVRLSGRLTRAVNQLYEGTRRVIKGDFRHRIHTRYDDQLGELGESFNQMTSNLERLFAVEKEKERLQTEIEIAREVQSQLYPKDAPPMRGIQLTVVCDPARMVSGDYYDYTELGQHQLAFAIGDVAGKGISAALLMATLQAALRSQVAHCEAAEVSMESARVVSQLNKQIYAHTAPEKYATFFFALFDLPSQTLTYTNAGHLSPLLLRKGEFTALDSNGTVVGAFPFAKYDSSSIVMEPDDLLVCYTDGITEPENAYGEMFGEERLMELVKKHSHQADGEILRIVLDAVRSWTGTPELYDDMTLLLARGRPIGMTILTAAEMREVDRLTIEAGIAGIILMENAGSRVVDFLRETFAPLENHRVVVICGKGNNGGDGFVIARQLFTRQLCQSLDVISLFDDHTGDALANRTMLDACQCPVKRELPNELQTATIVVDAVLGTGLTGAAKGPALDAIRAINDLYPLAKRVAVDIPSGLPSDDSKPIGEFAKADYTVTFTAAKQSQCFSPIYQHCGKLSVYPIGTPPAFYDSKPIHLTTEADLRHLFAKRPCDSNKGLYGHVFVVGGSFGKSGAPAMAGLGSFRSGAGLVTLAVPKDILIAVAAYRPEFMTVPLEEVDFKSATVLAVGPGMGGGDQTVRFVKRLYIESDLPAVFDADALNALAGNLCHTEKIRILTPHPGEMGRLMGISTKDVQADRLGNAQSLARKSGATIVLKGDRTVIAFPDGESWVNPTGSPSMATGGTGDILTGMTAGMVAQHPKDWKRAVCAAVWLHGRCGEIAAKHLDEECTLATDLLTYLPEAMNELRPRI